MRRVRWWCRFVAYVVATGCCAGCGEIHLLRRKRWCRVVAPSRRRGMVCRSGGDRLIDVELLIIAKVGELVGSGIGGLVGVRVSELVMLETGSWSEGETANWMQPVLQRDFR